nr:hypothetical protein [Clostridium sp.]
MKLWLKIYLFPLFLLILTLNLSGYILIQKFHNDTLEKEIDKCLAEQKFVSSQITINSIYMKKINSDTSSDINILVGTLMDEYNNSTNHEARQHGDIEILDSDDKILYSDMKFPVTNDKQELENLVLGKVNYIIRTVNDK